MSIPSELNAHQIDSTPLSLCKTQRRAMLNRQIKSITNILILMLCHMAANATSDRQDATSSNGANNVQRATPLSGLHVAPQLNTFSTSSISQATL
ncbi:hypothetical protein D3C81_1697400 [compost metagenome]